MPKACHSKCTEPTFQLQFSRPMVCAREGARCPPPGPPPPCNQRRSSTKGYPHGSLREGPSTAHIDDALLMLMLIVARTC